MNANDKREKAAALRADYDKRCAGRKAFEAQWQLNVNFVMGNQYCGINGLNEVEDTERDYFWQQREVYNHIATIVETRLAKLSRVRPKMSVRPFSSSAPDLEAAFVGDRLLEYAGAALNLEEKMARATMWSEITGTVFYKVTWNKGGGKRVGRAAGKPVCEGDVEVTVCPPFEVLPDDLGCQSIGDCQSIIHAKAVSTEEIYHRWGVRVEPEAAFTLSSAAGSATGGMYAGSFAFGLSPKAGEGQCLVIERYTRPTPELPDGELVIAASGCLLYEGVLPYINGKDGRRGLPFVKQEAITRAGCFYGVSMVERTIPIQRAYNAVKNRKHEFLNRIAMGVLAVEDGSVDTLNLEQEGLSPGKILVYRQGSNPPSLLEAGRVPPEFSYEEDRLLSEFIQVSGVSEIMRSSSVPSSVSSGVALQLLIEQDDTRLTVTAEQVRGAAKEIAQQTLRLYKQFATEVRVLEVLGGDGVQYVGWKASDLKSDDVVFETENELSSTPAAQRNTVLELLQTGLLHDEQGTLSNKTRNKILQLFGLGAFAHTEKPTGMDAAGMGAAGGPLVGAEQALAALGAAEKERENGTGQE